MPGGTIRLVPEHGSPLTLILNGPPDRSGGVGGWAATDRRFRRPAKYWTGQPDDTMSLDCTIDIDAINGPSVERRLRVLRTMGQARDDTGGDPPTITIDGDVWDGDRRIHWVMTDMKLGDRLYLPDGTLRRQQVTLDIERYNAIEEIKPLRVHRTRSKGKRRRHTVITKAGDTLRTVALRELGNAGRWTDLRKWNAKLKKVDPDQRLRSGTHVTIR